MKKDDNSFSEKFKGGVNKAKGEMKDQFGNLMDDAELQAEGQYDKARGEAQKKKGEMEERYRNDDVNRTEW